MAETAAAKVFAFDRVRFAPVADWLAIGVVISLPWSISLSQILTGAWLVALLPTLDVALARRALRHPVASLPVLLWLLALAGMVWANVSWGERFAGLEGFHKLLVVPLLLAQFRRSPRGMYALYAFFASCTALMVASWIMIVLWKLWFVYVPGKLPGILVKDYIAQSSSFLICMFAALGFAVERWRVDQRRVAIAGVVLAALFAANIFYVAPGRTALVLMPLLLLVFGFWFFGWKGGIAACLAAAVIAAAAWSASPMLRERVLLSISEVQAYQTNNTLSSSAIRLELLKRSLAVVETAPVLGHGTGSIPDQFRRAASGEGVSAITGENPHNQILAVAIQLGLVGVAILMTMWLWHLALFRGGGLIAWVGIVIVLQNLASAPFNAHLFDSFHGWLYVFLFGVAGGIALRERGGAA